MNMLIPILMGLLFLDCLLLLALILVQRGKGGGLAGAFGGMGGGEGAFGTRAVSTAKKATIVLATFFILLSAVLYMIRGREGEGGGPSTTPVPLPTPQDAPQE